MRRSSRDKSRLITTALLRKWALPDPTEEGSKEARGRALIIAGAVEMPGAAILASTAALRSGAGKVRVATAANAALAIAAAVPELLVQGIANGARREESLRSVLESAKNSDAVLIGSGMRDVEAIRFLLPELLRIESLHALIIDASAIPIAAEFLHRNQKLRGRIILTPHAGEMQTLAKVSADALAENSLGVTREVAARFASIVVLKG